MDNADPETPDNEREIEFTDLDRPAHRGTFQEFHFSRRTRIGMIVVSIVSAILFVSLTFGSQLYGLVYKPQPPKIVNTSHPASITLQTVMGGVVYAVDPDRMFYAIRASNGLLIWQSFSPLINQSLSSNGITYNVMEDGGVIVAQGKEVTPLWIYHLPSNSFRPLVIVDKHIYVVTQDNTLYVLNEKNGVVLWHYRQNLHISHPIIAYGGFVYILSDSGVMFTLRASDGSVLWHRQIPLYAQIVTVNENVIYMNNSDVIALHAKDGSVAWKRHLASTPVQPLVAEYGYVYVATFDNNMSAFNGKDGFLLWQHRLPSLAYEPVVVSNTMIYIHATDNSIYVLSAASGSLLWPNPVANILLFVVVDGTIYVVTMNNKVEAIDATGSILWQYQLSSAPIRPLLVSSGVIYTGLSTGTIYAFRARDSRLLWRYATQVP